MKILFLILITFLGANCFASDIYLDKLTPRLQNKLIASKATQDTTISLWLTLDMSQVVQVAVVLSKESLRRRKKVDSENFLIDSKDSTISGAILDSIRNRGVEIRHNLYWFDAVTVNARVSDLERVASLDFVEEIDIVQTMKSDRKLLIDIRPQLKTIQNKSLALPYGFSEFQNRYLKADKLHASGFTGTGIRIAMFDTGFKTGHRAFDSANIISTYNFIDNNSDVTQDDCQSSSQSSHGTMTFGVIGGYVKDTLIGIAHNAEFLLAKTEISCNGTEIVQEEDNWIAAAIWADVNGADIISSSLGYIGFQDAVGYVFADLDGDIPRITAAADAAASKNILVINSAGNERGSSWGHIIAPADGDSVIAVGATTPDSTIAGFSSPGPTSDGRIKPDISTLGTQVVSSIYTGGFTFGVSGTSFSAPLVSGAVALALEHDSTMTAAEARNLIRQSGDRYDFPDNNFGYGLFDAVKTADIVHFQQPYSFTVLNLGTRQFTITTQGRASVVPTLTMIDTIDGITFSDNNDGSGYLEVVTSSQSEPVQTVRVVSDVGYFADTTEFTIRNEQLLTEELVVGPNPCKDFVNIYFYDAINFQSLSIYTISGEKVWEVFNNYRVDADINRIEARWNCDNQTGEVVADGVYMIVVSSGENLFHRKIIKIE